MTMKAPEETNNVAVGGDLEGAYLRAIQTLGCQMREYDPITQPGLWDQSVSEIQTLREAKRILERFGANFTNKTN